MGRSHVQRRRRERPLRLHQKAVEPECDRVCADLGLNLSEEARRELICEVVRLASPWAFDGIDAVLPAERRDLIRIWLRCRLSGLAQTAQDETFWAQFERDRPEILGALLDGAACTLATWSETAVTGVRMADYARWVTASMPAFDWSGSQFLDAYAENRSGALRASLEAACSPTASADC